MHEFWFDPESAPRPQLTRLQRKLLDRLTKEFESCLGDSNTSNAKSQSQASEDIPYIRLPVKKDYVRSSDPPFKKNPKTRQLTIDFVRDLERRGSIDQPLYRRGAGVCLQQLAVA